MKNKSDEPEWFRRWFNSAYKSLYSHRHHSQALTQVKALVSMGFLSKNSLILDAACGAGRHMRAFSDSGYTVFGFDLSTELLKDTVEDSLNAANADMRFPPFKPGQFDLVTSFFSSFGYFASRAEDVNVLRKLLELVKPRGYIFLDLVSRTHVIKNLVPRDEKVIDGKNVVQERKIDGDSVIKLITITNENGEAEKYSEHLRLYSKEDMAAVCKSLSLETLHIFGTESGDPFDEESSPRMAMVLRKL